MNLVMISDQERIICREKGQKLFKIFLLMKMTFVLTIVACLQVSAETYSQRVTLSVNNVSLENVFKNIRTQTGYIFFYDKKLISNAKPVSVQVRDAPLKTALDKCFEGQNLTYSVIGETIVVKSLLTKNESKVIERNVETYRQENDIDIKGRVTDENGNGLEGVSVMIKGTKTGTTTKENGNYVLTASNDTQVLIFSMVGYSQVERMIGNNSIINVQMHIDATGMDEMVITGYYTRKKESFTGASTTITRKELEKYNNNNIFSVLQSIDPAFQIEQNINAGSNPNQIPQVNIRGISSVGSTVNLPLIIIDGIQGTLQQLYDMDVSRIESISILKDASATILYGSRAGNGVLVIETRLPKSGKLTVTYEARPSLTLVDLSDYSLMNASEKLEFERLAGVYKYSDDAANDPSWVKDYQMKLDNIYRDRLLAVKSGVNTYWLYQPVQSPLSIGHSLRAEGGNNEVRYSLDGYYNDVKGAIKESGRTRYGAGFNLIYRLANKINIRNNASFQGVKEYNSPYGSFSLYTRMNPYERIYNDNGKIITTYNDLGQFATSLLGGSRLYNPLYNAGLPYRNFQNSSNLTNNLSVEWNITPQLKLNATGIISKTFIDGEVYKSPLHTDFFSEPDAGKRGSYNIRNGNSVQYQGNLSVQYGETFGQHTIVANTFGEVRSGDSYMTDYALTGFVDDRFISPSLALQYKENSRPAYSAIPERLLGVASNIHYNYDQKYLADFSYRVDGSSKFGNENRFGSFWSVGLGYNLHREKFFNNDFINLLRIFGNVGQTGNENFTADMTSTAYGFLNNAIYYKKNAASYISQGNPFLTWPKVMQKSLGIDLSFWERRANVRFNVYDKLTNRMISAITVAPSMGFANDRLYENLGEVSNKGFELSASLEVYSAPSSDFYWTINFSAVSNKSKLQKISDELRKLNETLVVKDGEGNVTRPSSYYEENQSLTIFRGVRSLGIDPASGREMYLTRSGEKTYNWDAGDQVVIGDSEPKLRGTFGTDVSLKGFTVRLVFLYTLGADLYNYTLVNKVENASPYVNSDRRVLSDRWINPGDVKAFKGIADQTITQLTSRFVQKENTMQLSSFNVNYDFQKEKLRKYGLQRLRLNFSTNDMFRLSTIKMERGLDYPYARTYNLGILLEY